MPATLLLPPASLQKLWVSAEYERVTRLDSTRFDSVQPGQKDPYQTRPSTSYTDGAGPALSGLPLLDISRARPSLRPLQHLLDRRNKTTKGISLGAWCRKKAEETSPCKHPALHNAPCAAPQVPSLARPQTSQSAPSHLLSASPPVFIREARRPRPGPTTASRGTVATLRRDQV